MSPPQPLILGLKIPSPYHMPRNRIPNAPRLLPKLCPHLFSQDAKLGIQLKQRLFLVCETVRRPKQACTMHSLGCEGVEIGRHSVAAAEQ